MPEEDVENELQKDSSVIGQASEDSRLAGVLSRELCVQDCSFQEKEPELQCFFTSPPSTLLLYFLNLVELNLSQARYTKGSSKLDLAKELVEQNSTGWDHMMHAGQTSTSIKF